MDIIKKCSNGHSNSIRHNYCSKCGEEFVKGNDDYFSYTPLTETFKIKKLHVSTPIDYGWLVNEDRLIYSINDKYHSVRFTDYKNEDLASYPIWSLGKKILQSDTTESLLIENEQQLTILSKNYFSSGVASDNSLSKSSIYYKTINKLDNNSDTIFPKDTINSTFIVNGKNLLFIDAQKSPIEFSFIPQFVLTDNNYVFGISDSTIERISISTGDVEELEHASPIDRVALTGEVLYYLDGENRVWSLDTTNQQLRPYRVPGITNHTIDILAADNVLFVVQYDNITVINTDTNTELKKITGRFELNKVFLINSYIVAIEKGVDCYNVNIYDYRSQNISPRINFLSTIDNLKIVDIHYCKLAETTLIINFKANDGENYLATIKI